MTFYCLAMGTQTHYSFWDIALSNYRLLELKKTTITILIACGNIIRFVFFRFETRMPAAMVLLRGR